MLPSTVSTGVISSAGSKVMLTGGYLVLHKPNNGLVLGVDALLHSGVYPLLPHNTTSVTFNNKLQTVETYQDGTCVYPIVILTPQLRTEPLHLQLITKPVANSTPSDSSQKLTSGLEFELVGDYGKNSFASKSLHYSLIAISALLPQTTLHTFLSRGLLIDIRGDRSFYSSQPVANQSKVEGGQFSLSDGTTVLTETTYSEDPTDYTTKTGLGSSAAVVSSLVTSLFSYFGLFDNDLHKAENKTTAYRVAQVAHCIAQGKVGSGFDVATAFYGTQTYCRFSPSLLAALMASPLENASPSYRITVPSTHPTNNVSSTVIPKEEGAKSNPYSDFDGNCTFLSILTQTWDDTVSPFTLPPYLNIILADVQGGSETPGMVKKVEEWKKNGEGAAVVWETLANANKIIENHFLALNALSTASPDAWLSLLDCLGALPSKKWGSVIGGLKGEEKIMGEELVAMVSHFGDVRTLLRQMGSSCDVPIEPPSQTALIERTCEQNGVLFGGVPGAGGFDAVFAVIIQTPNTSQEIRTKIIQTWENNGQNGQNEQECQAIFCLPVGIDQQGGVQSRVAYKDFSKWY